MKDEVQNTLKPRQHYLKIKLVMLTAVVFVAIAGVGLYFWQYNKLNELNRKVSHLQTELKNASKPSSLTAAQKLSNRYFYI